jgi:hypothetical protein
VRVICALAFYGAGNLLEDFVLENDVNEKFGPHLLISFRKCIQRFLRLPPRGSNDFLNFNLDAHATKVCAMPI